MEAQKLKELQDAQQEKFRIEAELREQLRVLQQQAEALQLNLSQQAAQHRVEKEELELQVREVAAQAEVALQKEKLVAPRIRGELSQELIVVREELSRPRASAALELSDTRKAMLEAESEHVNVMDLQSKATWQEKAELQSQLADEYARNSRLEAEHERVIQELKDSHHLTCNELHDLLENSKQQLVAAENDHSQKASALAGEHWREKQQLQAALRKVQTDSESALAEEANRLKNYKARFSGTVLRFETAAKHCLSETQTVIGNQQQQVDALQQQAQALDLKVQSQNTEMDQMRHSAVMTEMGMKQEIEALKSANVEAEKRLERLAADKERQIEELRPLAAKVQAQLQSVIDERDIRITHLETEKQGQWHTLTETLKLTETEARSTLEAERRCPPLSNLFAVNCSVSKGMCWQGTLQTGGRLPIGA